MNLFDPPAARGPQPLAGLKVGDRIDWYYRVLEVSRRKTSKGKDFLILELMDGSGRMAAKVWDKVEEFARLLQPGQPVRLRGEVEEYRGKRDLRVLHVRAVTAADADYDESSLSEPARFDAGERLQQVRDLLAGHVRQPHLQRLVELFLADYGPQFSRHPGAQRIHHAYGGGLLEHTHSLLQLSLAVADHYRLDKELLLVGALLHDIGKMQEFRADPAPELTPVGGLLGHIVIGYRLFIGMRDRIPGFPEELSLRLEHMLVAHHGEKEFGSPETPRTPEAMALHVLDLLDSRLSIIREAQRGAEPGRAFSDFLPSLGTRVLLDGPCP